MASGPILTSEGKGPSRGRVVLGRLLDDAAIARLGEQARVQLSGETLEPRGAAAARDAAVRTVPCAPRPSPSRRPSR